MFHLPGLSVLNRSPSNKVCTGSCRAWQQRLEAASTKAQAEQQAAADSLAAAAAQREQQLLAQLLAVQQEAAAKLAAAEKEWSLKLAAAQQRALKVGWHCVPVRPRPICG